MGYNYSPLSGLDEAMKKSSGKNSTNGTPNSVKQAKTDASSSSAAAASNLNSSSLSGISASSSSYSMPTSQSTQKIKNNSQMTSASATPHALLTFKNNLFGELTRAIQLVN